jgi:hypothetical protein
LTKKSESSISPPSSSKISIISKIDSPPSSSPKIPIISKIDSPRPPSPKIQQKTILKTINQTEISPNLMFQMKPIISSSPSTEHHNSFTTNLNHKKEMKEVLKEVIPIAVEDKEYVIKQSELRIKTFELPKEHKIKVKIILKYILN